MSARPTILNHLLILSAVLCAAACSEPSNDWPDTEFMESGRHKTSESERYFYVDDLIRNQGLIGKPREKILEMLGEPSSKNANADRYYYVVKTGSDDFDQVFVLDIAFGGSKNVVQKVIVRGD